VQAVAATGATGGAATLVMLPTQNSIVAVTLASNEHGVKLPPDADTTPGDLVEFHVLPQGGANVWFDLYDNGGSLILGAIGDGHQLSVRKIAANTWSRISYF